MLELAGGARAAHGRRGREVEARHGQVSAAELLRDYDAVFLGLGLGADTRLGVPGEDGPGRRRRDGVDRAHQARPERSRSTASEARAGRRRRQHRARRRARARAPRRRHDDGLPPQRAPTCAATRTSSKARATTACASSRTACRSPSCASGGARRGPARRPADGRQAVAGTERGPARRPRRPRHRPEPSDRASRSPSPASRSTRAAASSSTAATQRTGNPKVFAGGDCVNGGKEVVNAVADGTRRRARDPRGRGSEERDAMADLSHRLRGIKCPNPFWLASAPPANTGEQVMRAFDAGWGGAVWKTLGDPIVNVSSRFGAVDYGNTQADGAQQHRAHHRPPARGEPPRDPRGQEALPEARASSPRSWSRRRTTGTTLIQKVEDAGCDGLELNFGCPHGMCERGMGSAVGQEPKLLEEITRWAKEFAKTPVLVKLTPNIGDIIEPGEAARARRRARHLAHQHDQEHHRRRPRPHGPRARASAARSTNGGYCGPAVKPIALHMVAALARDPYDRRSPSPASAASPTGATRPSSSRSARPASRCAPPSCTTATASSRT